MHARAHTRIHARTHTLTHARRGRGGRTEEPFPLVAAKHEEPAAGRRQARPGAGRRAGAGGRLGEVGPGEGDGVEGEEVVERLACLF